MNWHLLIQNNCSITQCSLREEYLGNKHARWTDRRSRAQKHPHLQCVSRAFFLFCTPSPPHRLVVESTRKYTTFQERGAGRAGCTGTKVLRHLQYIPTATSLLSGICLFFRDTSITREPNNQLRTIYGELFFCSGGTALPTPVPPSDPALASRFSEGRPVYHY